MTTAFGYFQRSLRTSSCAIPNGRSYPNRNPKRLTGLRRERTDAQRTIVSMRMVIIGPHLAGIGAQASLLSKRLSVPHFSPGEMLREAVRNGTVGGAAAQQEMEGGGVVLDDTTQGVVIERLSESDARNGFILHGFPETIQQAVALDETLRQKRFRLDAVIELCRIEQTSAFPASLKEPAGPNGSVGPVAIYYWNQQRLIVLDAPRDDSAMSEAIYKALALHDLV
ncbi:AAA family ATPase [Rhizobium sp. NZLR3b]|uniref:adenylate kinase family protein n=1 Tax=Rhizobium sp. NZLR3b TaxID=2731101 RepID=UPI001C839840|nr:nucleoside monophosphate kinase [Rhizobium sp. NZLR3b]MBX5192593.1 AAA family ATPase [Rhizobium sp. NZLR3b]